MQFVPPGLTHNYPIAEYIWNLIWSEIWKSYRYVVVQFSPWLFTALFRRMMAEKSTKMFITDILQSHFTTEISTDHIFLHSFQLKFHLSICKYHLILPTPKFRSLRKCFFFWRQIIKRRSLERPLPQSSFTDLSLVNRCASLAVGHRAPTKPPAMLATDTKQTAYMISLSNYRFYFLSIKLY